MIFRLTFSFHKYLLATISHHIPMIRDLSEVETATLAAKLSTRCCNNNEIICNQGDPGENLFLIFSGSVSVSLFLFSHKYSINLPFIH